MKKLFYAFIMMALITNSQVSGQIQVYNYTLGHAVAHVESENPYVDVAWAKWPDTAIFAYGQYNVSVLTEPNSYFELQAHSREWDANGTLVLDTVYVMPMGQGNNYPSGSVSISHPKFFTAGLVDTLDAMVNNQVLTQLGDSMSVYWMLQNGNKYYSYEFPLNVDTLKRYHTYNFFLEIWRQNPNGIGTYSLGSTGKSVRIQKSSKIFGPWSGRNWIAQNNDSVLFVAEPGYDSYKWFYNGVLIPKAKNDSVWVKNFGAYKYTAMYKGHKFTSQETYIWQKPASTPKISSSVKTDYLEVVNTSGQIIFSGKKENFNHEGLPAGLYIQRLEGKTSKFEIIK